jgi:hypothetical protein
VLSKNYTTAAAQKERYRFRFRMFSTKLWGMHSEPPLIDLPEDEQSLGSCELRGLRRLAGFSRSELEKRADLSAGRVRAVENGYARLRGWESAKVRCLLFEEMANRLREIAKHLPAVGPARVESSP